MCTVPAHSFCAPTRVKVIAAWRSMPGVWAVFASSWSPGMTRTPSCFQRGSAIALAGREQIDQAAHALLGERVVDARAQAADRPMAAQARESLALGAGEHRL